LAGLIVMAVQPSYPRRVSLSDGSKTPALPAALLRLASDERLVEQVRAGSETAFEVAYDRHYRGILAFCRHMLGSAEEAEDAVQHTFMAAFDDLLGSTKAIRLRPWLYTIARNRCYTLLRARRERPVGIVEELSTENLSAEVERRQDLRDLLGDLAGLPDEQRAALVLAAIGTVPHEEIAAVLGVPREKVKALVFQARTSLLASRRARETPCAEIRELLADLSGGARRRLTLRRHVRECAGCREFRDELHAQRRALALVLPVVPTLALKETVLGAVLGSGAAGGGGAIASAGGGALVVNALVAVALVGGGTVAGVEATRKVVSPERAAAARGTERSPSAMNGAARAAPPVIVATGPVTLAAPERAAAGLGSRRAPARTHSPNSREMTGDRVRPQAEQQSESTRNKEHEATRVKRESTREQKREAKRLERESPRRQKHHAIRLERGGKTERELRPPRPERPLPAPKERSAPRHSEVAPTAKAPHPAKDKTPVTAAIPVAAPTVASDAPEVGGEAGVKPLR
jgi:RNA polymerase sigma factor (sigma-70 family)